MVIIGTFTCPDIVQAQTDSAENAKPDDAWFSHHIQPILKDHCLECHSHASGTIEGGLALDSKSGWQKGGDSGPALVPRLPGKSLLLHAVRHRGDLKMPPEDKLTEAQIQLIEKWIKAGAPDPRQSKTPPELATNPRDWWSLRPLKQPKLPEPTSSQHPIDQFVNVKLKEKALAPAGPAKPSLLLRRLLLDLHGLPPKPEQVDAFRAELLKNRNRDSIWSAQVKQLLDSPRYGERWARHWLDTVHFADTHGCEHDDFRPNAWPFRDYVIQSLNEDKPWKRFVKEQLAADHFYPEQDQLLPALGFISAGPLELSRASTAPVTFDYLDRDDIVSQTMAAFASTTANCARCHDHKFDPISQEDYYSLQAVFAGGGKGDREFDADPKTRQKRKQLNHQLRLVKKRSPELLEDDFARKMVSDFETDVSRQAVWIPLDMTSFVSEQGATLNQIDDGSVLASGKNPPTDVYTISGTGQGIGSGTGSDRKLQRVTAIRLDVLPHDSLPTKGPGRCANGNLHLNRIEIKHSKANANDRSIAISSASADWDQQGWTIQHAIDQNPKSAWGIYPKVGEPHHAVFQLKDPVEVGEDSKLTIRLHQIHGGSHLIGRFRIYVTDSTSPSTRVLPDAVRKAMATEHSKRSVEQKLDLTTFVLGLDLERKLAALPSPQKVYAWSRLYSHSKKLNQPMAIKTVHVLKRGNIDRPGKVATPGSLSAIDNLSNRFHSSAEKPESFRRAALANWMIHKDNPLFWRSIVNRVWSYHFGRGLCDTPNDFGRMGSIPSHPELLDWLAVWFRDEANGSLKKLHHLILTSKTWQQAATTSVEMSAKANSVDANNTLLWKSPLRKLDAESFRDSVLQISGELDLTMGGPGIEQFSKSKGRQTTPVLDYDKFDWNSPGGKRRSIYRIVWRGIADPFMESLDFPDLGLLTGKRENSSSALQALATYNHDFVLNFSSVMASKLEKTHEKLSDQVENACRLIWLRRPNSSEKQLMTQYVKQHSLAALCRVLLNSNEFIFVR